MQVSTSASFGNYVYNDSGLTDTNRQVSGLNIGTTYYWRVYGMNNYGRSVWSAVWNFTTDKLPGTPCPETPKIGYAGKIYNTVQIGNQCWLKKNLDVGSMIDGLQPQSDNGVIEKYCFRNDTANCTLYGGLYDWGEAMQYGTSEGTQGICPAGWHIPTSAEFDTLAKTVNQDSDALKAVGQGTGVGAGTNITGFTALLGGATSSYSTFYGLYIDSYFWRSTRANNLYPICTHIWDNYKPINTEWGSPNPPILGYSVRCIKN
ncbi:MAG: FISUMP domain-containing protein [Bacteroidota bacterium]